ncbi:MAG: NUDIX hydrolase [Candidatus Eremiobacteraeota bacterium]|nr:NUDIX hydrolase [Candidatus Eremiobacteraeota bacterium]MBV8284368.1 NUDIX hydrolase [Candidatus Eremiobacteraeota bacterium]MBV8433194.1 NUDIX hydrolase [Candidatus Eremiobacteraeota bacterium]MBV8583945.1 NUDIX hydrolase [Candidatus Eremiobacteraeota bacterium]MBV8656161.1 NUDIX hydrolase [Candidatus Eremiobacteraeota bacterium]
MQKPHWTRRSSKYLVESPFMRLRADEIELPDGTIVPEYFIRESAGFVIAFAVTPEDRIVAVRQYRYGSDDIHLELPAGMVDDGEDPLACVKRELSEETGYESAAWEFVGAYYAEPVRSAAKAHVFFAAGARRTREPKLDPTEALEVEQIAVADFREMLKDGRIDHGHTLTAGYRVLDYLGRL